jgi:hypothetical protein
LASHKPAQPDLSLRSRAKHFRRKAAECQRQADLAKYGETQEAFRKLVLGYEKLAAHAESIERQNGERKIERDQAASFRERAKPATCAKCVASHKPGTSHSQVCQEGF